MKDVMTGWKTNDSKNLVCCYGMQETVNTITHRSIYMNFSGKQFAAENEWPMFMIMIIIIIYLLTARVVGTPQMTSQPVFSIFPYSPLPFGTWWMPGLSMSFHLFFCLPHLLPPFTVPCKMVLARPDEQETWPYHCSLHLFTLVKRSLCGLIACWILAWTSLLVTWSLYEMCSILQ